MSTRMVGQAAPGSGKPVARPIPSSLLVIGSSSHAQHTFMGRVDWHLHLVSCVDAEQQTLSNASGKKCAMVRDQPPDAGGLDKRPSQSSTCPDHRSIPKDTDPMLKR